MPLIRRASRSAKLTALVALSLACARCSSDAVDTGAASNAGSPAHAGAPASSGGHAGTSEQGNAGSNEGGASGAPFSPAGAGGETTGQGGATDEPTDAIPTFNGCAAEDYEDQRAAAAPRVIEIATQGLTFTPPCLLIAVGQTVRFQGSLSSHPLAPGNPEDPDAGSAASPIQATSSGQSVEFKFPDAGTFPYYCELHSFGDGQGMAGVVHVRP
ncbi:MAG TPA: plastocyanin/azurin family copper-binding protein [Polyangiaceae bacterium]|nr:plastocyanin/azurin family copper-binding protein [Polyangiaceae bacterium]